MTTRHFCSEAPERVWLVLMADGTPYSVRSTEGSALNYARNLDSGCTVAEYHIVKEVS